MSKKRLIDGTKATKDIMKYSRDLHEAGNTDAAGYVMWAASIVDIQPTIDPVRHGKWEDYDGVIRINCSNCGKVYLNTTILEVGKCNFCPNCGAKMDKE